MKVISKDVTKTVLEGAEHLYEAVRTTMGPMGRNVVIRSNEGITVTHDGVTVANAINPKDDKAVGVRLIKQAANKMNHIAGDGTTTVTVLAYNIMKEATQLVDGGYSPMQLRRELEGLSSVLTKYIESKAVDVKDSDILAQVATISAADKETGELVAEVVNKVGHDGSVAVELSPSSKTSHVIVDGCKINYGYASPHFVTDQQKMVAEASNLPILVVKGKINSIHDLIPAMERSTEAGHKGMVVYCEEAGLEVLANLIHNKKAGKFDSIVVAVPPHATVTLEDIAAVTGATMVDKGAGKELKDVSVSDMGSADKVISSATETTLVGSKGDIKDYIKGIDSQDERSEIRIATLRGKVAVISVGGANDDDMQEKKYRVEDAVAAAKAALKGGVVAGGGRTLVEASMTLDESAAGNVLVRALGQPFNILLSNAGLDAADYDLSEGQGVNVATGEVVDMAAEGILDPAAVTKEAVANAISVAALAITAGAIIDTTEQE